MSALTTGAIARHARVAAEAAEYTTDLPTIYTVSADEYDITFQGSDAPEAKTLALRLAMNVEHADFHVSDKAATTTYRGEWHDAPVVVVAYVPKAVQS